MELGFGLFFSPNKGVGCLKNKKWAFAIWEVTQSSASSIDCLEKGQYCNMIVFLSADWVKEQGLFGGFQDNHKLYISHRDAKL